MALCFLKPTTFLSPNLSTTNNPKPSTFKCNFSLPTFTTTEPVFTSVKAFAPATVANLGPGFDFLGAAVDGLGDFVSLRLDPSVHPGELSISEISGSTAKLSKNPLWNCAGISALSAMKMFGIRSVGLSLSLHKGLPLGFGLGSSAASAAAAAGVQLQGNLRAIKPNRSSSLAKHFVVHSSSGGSSSGGSSSDGFGKSSEDSSKGPSHWLQLLPGIFLCFVAIGLGILSYKGVLNKELFGHIKFFLELEASLLATIKAASTFIKNKS